MGTPHKGAAWVSGKIFNSKSLFETVSLSESVIGSNTNLHKKGKKIIVQVFNTAPVKSKSTNSVIAFPQLLLEWC